MFIGLAIFIIFFALVSYMLGNQIYKSISKKVKINKVFFWIFFFFIASSYIIYTLFKSSLPFIISKILAYIGAFYLGASFYLIILFSISFIINYFLRNIKIKLDLYLISLALVIVLLPIGAFYASSPYIKNYDITTAKSLDDNLKIALVSDIHLGEIIDNHRLDKMIEAINSQNPDIVLIAGDLIDSDLTPVLNNNFLDNLHNIKSRYGTFFSPGNHDVYTNRINELSLLLEKENITVLRDNITLVDNKFYIVGRDDIATNRLGENRLSISEILSKTSNLDLQKPLILIEHNPDSLSESIENNIDLQVSGHTHNGQIFPLNVIINKLFQIGYGYEKFSNTNVIVTSGYGTWGPPIRLGSRSEIVIINMIKES